MVGYLLEGKMVMVEKSEKVKLPLLVDFIILGMMGDGLGHSTSLFLFNKVD